MKLHEYPRPTNDTGIGIHWSPGFAASIGLGKIRDYWIPEMKAMGIKWVKIPNHDGAKEFTELLLAEGFMPIVRIYRGRSNPGRMTLRDLVEVDTLTRIGVHYIEFNNEPDQDAEWKGGRVPANAIDIVVEDVVADLEALLERGAMPAIPAVSGGSSWDIIGKIVEKGRKDLLDGPIWQAIHNFSRNRPLDYPYDIGNQEGTPYTDRFYRTVSDERPGFDPWHGRPLYAINQLRAEHANPRATIADDHACWLAYQHFNQRHQHHLGRSIPILATENGYLISENTDPRYPATTPNLHMAQTLEACRIMMGSSERFKAAPDYYFCSAFSVIANQQLGSQANWYENRAWYSERWFDGALPIVQALRSEPKVLRRWQGDEQGDLATIKGSVRQADEHPIDAPRTDTPRTVVLDQQGNEIARVLVDTSNRYSFPNVKVGPYTVRIEGTDLIESVTVAKGQRELRLDLDLSTLEQGSARSVLVGKVRGGSGSVVMLLRVGDGEEWVTMAEESGEFRFMDLPAGTYNVRVYPRGSRVQNFTLDGENERELSLAKEGWGHTIDYIDTSDGEPTTKSALPTLKRPKLRCAVQGYKGLSVQATTDGWRSNVETTGSDPAFGEFACELDLSTHHQQSPTEEYTLQVDGIVDAAGTPIEVEADVQLMPGKIPFVTFSYYDENGPQTASDSVISGTVRGDFLNKDVEGVSAPHAVGSFPDVAWPVVILRDGQGREQRQRASESGSYSFGGLSAGLYSIFLEAVPANGSHAASGAAVEKADAVQTKHAMRSDLALDGTNRLTVDLAMPIISQSSTNGIHNKHNASDQKSTVNRSIVAGVVPGAIGATARLIDTLGNEYVRIVGNDERVRFSGLGAGIYTLTVDGGFEEENIVVDERHGCEVFFTPLSSQWVAEVSATGSMPGFSAVRVEVVGKKGLPVYLSKADWDGMNGESGSRPDLGEFALEFSPLEPGYYIIEPDGLDVRADVHLTGLEAVWVSFREKNLPSNPNVVLPLTTEVNQPFESTSAFVDQYAPARPIGAKEKAKEKAEAEAEGVADDEATWGSIRVPDVTGPLSEEDDVRDGDDSHVGSEEEPSSYEALDAPAVSPQLQPLPEPQDEPHQYLYIGSRIDWSTAEFSDWMVSVLRYVALAQPEIGSDRAAAARADEVIILGEVDTSFVDALVNDGIHVARVTERLIEAFKQLYEGE